MWIHVPYFKKNDSKKIYVIHFQLTGTGEEKQKEVEGLQKQLSEQRESTESQQRQYEQQIADLQLQYSKVGCFENDKNVPTCVCNCNSLK